MGSSNVPHYARFARTLALVSVALPMPCVTILGASSCSSSTTSQGIQVATGDSGIQQGPVSGSQGGPPMGSQAVPDDGGDEAAVAEGGGGIQAMDGGDAADDGGGPHRGTPELPDSFRALLA